MAVAAVIFNPAVAFGQALTGELICTVKDANGAVVQGATVRLALPALIGGAVTRPTPAKGQLRFPVLPPGSYVMDIEMEGFAPVHEADIRIGAGQQIERYAVLRVAGVAESIVVIAATGSPARPRPGCCCISSMLTGSQSYDSDHAFVWSRTRVKLTVRWTRPFSTWTDHHQPDTERAARGRSWRETSRCLDMSSSPSDR